MSLLFFSLLTSFAYGENKDEIQGSCFRAQMANFESGNQISEWQRQFLVKSAKRIKKITPLTTSCVDPNGNYLNSCLSIKLTPADYSFMKGFNKVGWYLRQNPSAINNVMATYCLGPEVTAYP